MDYVLGDSYRLFVNSSIGCRSLCNYCYLPLKGVELGVDALVVLDSDVLIDRVLSTGCYQPGEFGTIISIGCFSECWDIRNRAITIEVMKFFLEKGNFVQFATKRYVEARELNSLLNSIQRKGQLTIFISCSTISNWKVFEPGTTEPRKRLSAFEKLKQVGIPSYLYIKPVIQDVTIRDLDIFKSYAKICSGVVVGTMFSRTEQDGGAIPIPIDGLSVMEVSDEEELKLQFQQDFNQVFSNSTQAIEHWRGAGKNG
ncbi:hypothetical protein [Teredinibacter turnerae]|uniref:hypothetical protein n=1 Tax=Teredinibacter turnerae TaxID=2426 RepID=UPI000410639B|nr:hypothetical protein [Teredinibacter turnerae]